LWAALLWAPLVQPWACGAMLQWARESLIILFLLYHRKGEEIVEDDKCCFCLFWWNGENTATIYCSAASHAKVLADILATVVCHPAQRLFLSTQIHAQTT
jgi:hypothetical protein